MMSMKEEKEPGLCPGVLCQSGFLIRTGAVPPGPPRGTTSACESERKESQIEPYS